MTFDIVQEETLAVVEPPVVVKTPPAITPFRKSNAVAARPTIAAKETLSKVDFVVFATYFCNIVVSTLSVVTVPAMAIEYNLPPQAMAAFCTSVAGMASLGGGMGKLVNGFVCQYLGGHRASWIYLLALAALKMAMSFSQSLAPIGMCLVGVDFLSSVQWTSNCAVMMNHYGDNPRKIARGITLLSLSSTIGAMCAKIIGAGLLQATEWRTVCRLGSVMALVGSSVMYFGGDVVRAAPGGGNSNTYTSSSISANKNKNQSPLVAIKSILSNPIFWMFGFGHSLGTLARSSDRLLGPFLQEVGGISGSVAAALTSSVTIGFVLGLIKGGSFSKMKSIEEKIKMVKKNAVISVLSVLGLAACGTKGVSNLVGGNSNALVAAITLFSGLTASAVSFQFYQFANLMSSNIFPEHTSVALSFTDGVGFFTTAAILGINSRLVGSFGWCTSWVFIAAAFAVGGMLMTQAIQPVLVQVQANENQRHFVR